VWTSTLPFAVLIFLLVKLLSGWQLENEKEVFHLASSTIFCVWLALFTCYYTNSNRYQQATAFNQLILL